MRNNVSSVCSSERTSSEEAREGKSVSSLAPSFLCFDLEREHSQIGLTNSDPSASILVTSEIMVVSSLRVEGAKGGQNKNEGSAEEQRGEGRMEEGLTELRLEGRYPFRRQSELR